MIGSESTTVPPAAFTASATPATPVDADVTTTRTRGVLVAPGAAAAGDRTDRAVTAATAMASTLPDLRLEVSGERAVVMKVLSGVWDASSSPRGLVHEPC